MKPQAETLACMSRQKISIRQQQFGFPDEDIKTSLHDEIVLWLKKDAQLLAQRILNWQEKWDDSAVEGQQKYMQKLVNQLKVQINRRILEDEGFMKMYGASGATRAERIAADKMELEAWNSWPGLGVPAPPVLGITSEIEAPITRERNRTKEIIGYADIVYRISTPVLGAGGLYVDEQNRVVREKGCAVSWRLRERKKCIALDAKTTIPSFGELVRCLRTYREYCNWDFYIVSPDARFAEHIAEEGFGFIQYPEGAFLAPKPTQGPI